MESRLIAARPWVSQGDVFADVPIVRYGRSALGQVTNGPSLLLTADCQLDKRTRSGQTKIRTLQFAPLQNVEDLDQNRRALIRRDGLQPPNPFYLGEVDTGAGEWEAFVLLDEIYAVPIESVGAAEMVDHSEEMEDEDDAWRLHLVDVKRLYSLHDSRRDLLHDKITAFWTGTVADRG